MWTNFLGKFNDQAYALWWAWWQSHHPGFAGGTQTFSPLYGAPFGFDLYPYTNEIITWTLLKTLAYLFGNVFAYNLLILLSVLLTVFITYIFARKWFGIGVSVYITTAFSFSSYFLERISNHMSLAQIWVVPLYLMFFHTKLEKLKLNTVGAVLLGLLLTGISLISNYYGFFLLVYTICAFAFSFISDLRDRSKSIFTLKQAGILFVSFGLSFALFFGKYLSATYSGTKIAGISSITVSRTIEDHFIYSAKPWYVLLPSSKNPFFGMLTNSVVSKIKSTNYFVFNHYIPSEDVAVFFGWVPTVLVILFVVKYKKIRAELSQNEARFIGILLTFIVAAFLLSTPPYITISGYKIYLPGYWIYKYVKVFRVTSRIGVIIYLAVLFISAFWFRTFLKDKGKKFAVLCIAFASLFTILQMFIPLHATNVSNPPEIFTYIKNRTATDAIIAVYPYSYSSEVLFWMSEYQRGLINPRYFENDRFDSEAFTKKLMTVDGIAAAKQLGVDYLLFFKDKEVLDKDLLKVSRAEIVKEFPTEILIKL